MDLTLTFYKLWWLFQSFINLIAFGIPVCRVAVTKIVAIMRDKQPHIGIGAELCVNAISDYDG